jgi:hypothetical protein
MECVLESAFVFKSDASWDLLVQIYISHSTHRHCLWIGRDRFGCCSSPGCPASNEFVTSEDRSSRIAGGGGSWAWLKSGAVQPSKVAAYRRAEIFARPTMGLGERLLLSRIYCTYGASFCYHAQLVKFLAIFVIALPASGLRAQDSLKPVGQATSKSGENRTAIPSLTPAPFDRLQ